MPMKILRGMALGGAVLSFFLGSVRAQEGQPQSGSGGEAAKQEMIKKAAEMYQKGGDEGPDPQGESEHYARNLNLDPQQKGEVLKILEDRRKVFKESARARRQFKEQTERLHQKILQLNEKVRSAGSRIDAKQKQTLAKIRALLRPDQQSRFDMMEKERARMEQEFRERQEENYRREHGGEGPRDGQGAVFPGQPPEQKQ
jgi:protein CpxP